ncbi:MAG: 2-C-methyl-D-erythritol 4-phosphate cytidylyltransferase [Phycisphaerales bacterium]|nr:MAG: 2-C-methyl-D-erythritol 4-phosphate cytidylyltransferase [Phycisphaerales bacterium]
MKLGVIIPAAGASRRFGGRSKVAEDLGGRPVLQRTVELFVNRDEATCIVVAAPVVPDGALNEFKARFADKFALLGVRICEGGREHRWQSVRNALAEIPDDCTHIAVHDGARPCASTALIDRVLEAARKHPAVIPALDVPDTLKRVSAEAVRDTDVDPLDAILGDAGKSNVTVRRVEETVSRAHMVLVQTPQVFDAALLRRAYGQADLDSTDDAQLIERLGESVTVVEGDAWNVKITRPSDIDLARRILGAKGPSERPSHLKF